MNAVQTRQRRWSSRLNNMANNATAAAAASSNSSSLIGLNEGAYQIHYPTYSQTERVIYETPGITLRPLPFYDVVDELIRPAGLISDGVVGRLNESRVEFKLTIDQADMVAMSLNSKQLLLRFCHLDITSEQDDNFPPEVTVSVNGGSVTLPPAVSNPNKPNIPPKRPGQHVDITNYCKLCPFISNVIEVKWYVDTLEPSRSYVINVILAEKVSADTLLKRIKDRGLSDPETTKRIILDSDNEVATVNQQTSLVCPLGKMRMSVPCKSTSCQHIMCFDALFYLQMNEKKASWTCPTCYKPAYFRDLMIDGFFMDILEHTTPNVTEVTLHVDGTWSPVIKTEQPTSESQGGPEIITISDDDED